MSLVARWGPRVARTLLGLVFFVFGLNFFLHFLPQPPPPPKEAGVFIEGLMVTGYVFPLIKAIEIAAGLALLANRFVPLALTVLAPILINIAGFHFVLAPAPAMPIVLLALELYLAWSYRAAFAPMLRARVEPAASAEEAPAGRTVTAG
ncbi:DoxX family protein [Vitiosangium sp. GDMCC 1.1324]|uniref:DoxX family protein n=1 Tax=Vitiosangium sp. (strain GDMCC 1.1324) TaxID=2138576 RepID=UPI000D3A6263|nr:DoxX family protein [Vitiosangium sp. GDMCC 1.1324]PTL82689.1 DoxX family protein [Vitiosangium sp. GDMCC 1.1324]